LVGVEEDDFVEHIVPRQVLVDATVFERLI